jgi:hypothetical protein
VDGDAGPFSADWAGDGDLDLLVGTGNGSVLLYRNTGRRNAPELARGETLVDAARVSYANPPLESTPGMHTKVCAADWNGDGCLDLPVGDFTLEKLKPVEYTAGETAEHERLRLETSELQKRSSEIYREIGFFGAPSGGRKFSPEELDKREEELSRLHQCTADIREKLPHEVETRGWVWLYLRRGLDGPSEKGTLPRCRTPRWAHDTTPPSRRRVGLHRAADPLEAGPGGEDDLPSAPEVVLERLQ